MSVFSRRKFLVGSLSSVTLAVPGGSEMPLRLPFGPNPFDPRQPQRQVILPPQPVLKNPIYTDKSPATPVHLSGSVVMPSGSNGTVPPAALKNPMGADMEILEIKFELSAAVVGGAFPVMGGTIWCELVMGSYKLTNGAIPVWNFGRVENFGGESKADSTDLIGFESYSWRLPRPLFVPAGAVVTPNFTHTGFFKQTINARIGYSARTVTKKPKQICMPWVAKYASTVFNPISAAGVDTSSELDLVNPNPEVLHLQRFVGRTAQISSEGITSDDPTQPAFGSQYLNLRMTDSYGRPIIRNYTPFRMAFGSLTRSWEMDNGAELDPESYYLVNLRKDAMTVATAGAAGQAFISMVGWRELENTL